MYRNKKRNNRYYSYIFSPTDNGATLSSNDVDAFDGIDWTLKTPRSQASQLNYDSKEHIGAVYGMVTLSSKLGEPHCRFPCRAYQPDLYHAPAFPDHRLPR